ncbi:MAG TPA: 3-phosphoshikimate 1-carboxyvinyltransferase [Salinimicrobium sp.]|nr:3-phosphoshikimate 1-carboxyvinyltransferase [Salinimicrobium sp.]
MDLQLGKISGKISGEINITGSKSESNRLLILQALYPQIEIKNLSNSDDSRILQKALISKENTIDIHHAGTAMRFLTAFFAISEGREIFLTGSDRMQERPVKLLVDALRDLGADIEYAKKEGFPPLKIKGTKLRKEKVKLKANISSQYISALMLVAPVLPNGLEIVLEGPVTSQSYIHMTCSLLKKAGFEANFRQNKIKIEAKKEIQPVSVTVESDWSSASYFYSIAALSEASEITLSSFKKESFQGDAVVAGIYEKLGVKTSFLDDKIMLNKIPVKKTRSLILDLTNSPDLAQTLAVSCFGLGIKCELNGLHTLKIKETDRLLDLKTEIEKAGGKVEITSDSLKVFPSGKFNENTLFETYNDHRMAMAFAPLALKFPCAIKDAEVVSKSYPEFWEDLKNIGFSID